MKEVKGGEEKSFPKKCAYLRRWKKKLFFLAALTALTVVLLILASGSGKSDLIGPISVGLLLFLAVDVLFVVLYAKLLKRIGRFRRVYAVKIERGEMCVRWSKSYYFGVVYSTARGKVSGTTEALYSKRAARRAEEAFQKGDLRVFYDPERNVEQVIFPDI